MSREEVKRRSVLKMRYFSGKDSTALSFRMESTNIPSNVRKPYCRIESHRSNVRKIGSFSILGSDGVVTRDLRRVLSVVIQRHAP